MTDGPAAKPKKTYPAWHYLVACLIAALFSLNLLNGQYVIGGLFLALAVGMLVLYVRKRRAERATAAPAA